MLEKNAHKHAGRDPKKYKVIFRDGKLVKVACSSDLEEQKELDEKLFDEKKDNFSGEDYTEL